MINKPQRKRLRLQYYNYAEYGCYFVTICTHNRIPLLGNITDGKMQLNAVGNLVQEALLFILTEYSKSEISHYVIMPNHLHFIWFNRDEISLSFVIKMIKGRSAFAYRQYNLA